MKMNSPLFFVNGHEYFWRRRKKINDDDGLELSVIAYNQLDLCSELGLGYKLAIFMRPIFFATYAKDMSTLLSSRFLVFCY